MRIKIKSFQDAMWYIKLDSTMSWLHCSGVWQGLWQYKAIFLTKDNMEGIPQQFETKSYSNIKYLKNVVIRRIINNNKMENVYSGYNISNNNTKDNIGYSGS